MGTHQQYSTRLGVRTNLKTINTRLTLDINTLRKIESLYLAAKPQVSEAARLCAEACELLKTLITDLRSNI